MGFELAAEVLEAAGAGGFLEPADESPSPGEVLLMIFSNTATLTQMVESLSNVNSHL